ncbi:MAG: signal peptidase I [candidate division Zixibacteria bacterium]|nr:signal peptidase I [candidate division Zixibacteria bacterium]
MSKRGKKTKKSDTNINKQIKKEMLDDSFSYVKAIIFAVIAAFLIKTSLIEAYGIPSSSMEDTLLIGDLVVSNKIIYGSKLPLIDYRFPAIRKPQQGDIITFEFPGDRSVDYVKRCVATEGQVVRVVNKVLYVDGKKFENPEFSKYEDGKKILLNVRESVRDNFGPFKVPKDHVFAMGDNRDRSYDSRFWGTVPLELIEGKVMFIQWSLAEDKTATQIDLADLTTIPMSVYESVSRFAGRIRWERTLMGVE